MPKIVAVPAGMEEEQEDDGHSEDVLVDRLVQSMKQHGEFPAHEFPEKKKRKKKTRAEMDDRTLKWQRKRDQIFENADNKMFDKEVKEKPLFQMPLREIQYADTSEGANLLAANLLKGMKNEVRSWYPFGFDTEGGG